MAGEYTVQYKVLQNGTLETHIMLFTNVPPTNFIKNTLATTFRQVTKYTSLSIVYVFYHIK